MKPEFDDTKVALIDLDGTVADFEKALRDKLAELASPHDFKELGSIDEWTIGNEPYPDWLGARISLIKKQDGFWENLPPIPTGMGVYNLLGRMGYQRMVLTQGPRSTETAWTEKKRWCSQYLPTAGVTITQDKSLFYGKVLFDDYPPYIRGWLKYRPRGKVLMLEATHNKGFQHPNLFSIKRYEGPSDGDKAAKQLKQIEKFLNQPVGGL